MPDFSPSESVRLINAREDIAVRRAVARKKGEAGTYTLAVLALADLILDRHARTHICVMRWTDDGTEVGQYIWPVLPCADVKPVLDLYAPSANGDAQGVDDSPSSPAVVAQSAPSSLSSNRRLDHE